ncbi:alpha-L-arabinofuranosidase C-terminal domain-containing protein [Paludibacter jiangxiensis]|uniref:non-reducing end alpha-L-arabinofuranosidase n=1 Tax=Paludibacter jiangxiensis TaxID=681398 RepID=A0A171ATE7_9BACT|nr:alpha-L-arabinofuranosidase C-terminal domain-containing protein [Paludibacter jiangxiensis]GAT64241.1 alpha-N-arabinofuranosidase [Paludibacter jiangxiensis]
MKKTTLNKHFLCSIAVGAMLLLCPIVSAQKAKLTLDFTQPGANVSPMLYGLMTEEINHSYDGGLYAELIRNRIFKDNKTKPEGWSLVQQDTASRASIKLIAADPDNVPFDERRHSINSALTTCLRLTVAKGGSRVGVANEGYWGIPVKPSTTYKASFYMKGTGSMQFPRRPGMPARPQNATPAPVIENNTAGPITVTIESNDGKTVYATGTITLEKSTFWKKYEVTLTTAANVEPTTDARFVISTDRTGLYYFNLVSLFPPTYNNRPNGNRIDLTQMMVDMKPKFLRFPGGNFLEGPDFANAFPWKTTLGPIDNRPGHKGSWGYRPTDGMGLYEFLMWCEEIGAEPVLGVYAGYSLNGDHVDAGPLLKPYVEDALDEIEYVTGDKSTYWGAKRAADGHPEPFKLTYVEIGNEDWFDRTNSYDGRFKQFREAIEKKYPQLTCISTITDTQNPDLKVTGKKPDVMDEHYYRNSWEMFANASQYDKYDRKSSKVFVGEWATREGAPTTNLHAALGDAAWMTGMERNSDLIIMSCYAPLFVNVNTATSTAPKAWQWDSDLIGYNALTAFGSPSYYVQKAFGEYLGNKIVPATAINIPTQNPPLSKRDSINGTKPAPVPVIFYSATQDDKTGMIYLKVVNASGKIQPVEINLKGLAKVDKKATIVVIKGAKPEDTNTISEPKKIVPATFAIKGIGTTFSQKLAPYSVNILQLKIQK